MQNILERRLRIAIITNTPTPYRQKQWECYSKIHDLSITVFYCSKREKNRFWNVQPASGVREVFLKGVGYREWHFNPGIFLVPFQKFDIFLIGGYSFPTVMIAIVLLRLFKKNWALISDGVSPPKLKSQKWYVRLVQRFFTNGATAYFANGTASKKRLKQFGIPDERVFDQYLTVDVSYFLESEKASRKTRIQTRRRHKIEDDATVVFVRGANRSCERY